MATFTKRDGVWRAQVRKKGQPTLSKTFSLRVDAERWARDIEAGIARGTHLPSKEAESTTLADLLRRYLLEVSPAKRSGNSDKGRVSAICTRLGAYKLTALTPRLLAESTAMRSYARSARKPSSIILRSSTVL